MITVEEMMLLSTLYLRFFEYLKYINITIYFPCSFMTLWDFRGKKYSKYRFPGIQCKSGHVLSITDKFYTLFTELLRIGDRGAWQAQNDKFNKNEGKNFVAISNTAAGAYFYRFSLTVLALRLFLPFLLIYSLKLIKKFRLNDAL